MSDEIKAEEAAKADEPKTEEFRMPGLEQGAATFFDTNSKNFWVGIPLAKADPVTCLAILDRSKFDLLQHYNKMAMEMQRLAALRQPPSLAERTKQRIGDIFHKLAKHS